MELTRARLAGIALALVPAALMVYLGFHGGGFFAGSAAAVAIAVLLLLALRVMIVAAPVAGLNRWVIVAAAGLGLFALWTLISGSWSGAPDRALLEFDRALLYCAALVVFGSVARESWRLRWMLRGLAVAALVICVAGLATRLLPETFPLAVQTIGTRLSYPITYWNAFGLSAAVGLIICFGLTCDALEPRAGRVLAAAAMPVLASGLLLTLSRGSIAAAVLGILVFAVVGHPRSLISGLVATLPVTAVALVSTYDADLLVTTQRFSAAAQDQGHHVAVVVMICSVAAGGLRALGLMADVRMSRQEISADMRRRALGTGVALVVIAVTVAAVAADVPRQYDRFVGTEASARAAGPRDDRARLTDPTNVVRLKQWRVALDDFQAEPLHGTGAGTFELGWNEHRPIPNEVRDAHSLYVEVLGELGLVGFVLLLTTIVAILAGIFRLVRGPDRVLHATIAAALLTWAVAAGIDWHWEMPVVTLWVFALAGAALARAKDERTPAWAPSLIPRTVLAVGLCVLMVLVPLRVAISQHELVDALVAPLTPSCDGVDRLADRSIAAVASRPQPYEVKANCALEAGRPRTAIDLLHSAIRREPDNWRLRYDLAVARARAGLDPRAPARGALKLNPRNPDALAAAKRFFDTETGAAAWRASGAALRLQTPTP